MAEERYSMSDIILAVFTVVFVVIPMLIVLGLPLFGIIKILFPVSSFLDWLIEGPSPIIQILITGTIAALLAAVFIYIRSVKKQ